MGIQRLKVTNPWKSYIYHIHTTERKLYIGQSDSILGSSDRIDQHIKNAFYGKVNDAKDSNETSELYSFIRRKGLDHIQIHAYSAQNNYGFSNFEEAYNQFTKEWAPGGKALKYLGKDKVTKQVKHADFNPNIAVLDFAEIGHLMSAVQSKYDLYNKEMGGKVRGLVAIDNEEKKIKGSDGKKVLTPSMSPQDAYKMFSMRHSDSNVIALTTQELYSDMFSSDWKNILATKYKDVDIPNRANIQKSWQEFCTNDLFGNYIAGPLKDLFNNLKNPSQKEKFKTQINDYIVNNFLEPREDAANKMIKYIQDLRRVKTRFKMSKYFNWTLLADALVDPIVNASVKAFGAMDTKGIRSIQNNFKLVNAAFVWDLDHFSQNKVMISWLRGNNDSGEAISTNYLKYEALVVFDYFIKRALRNQQSNWKTAFEEEVDKLKTTNRVENEQKLTQAKKRQKKEIIMPVKPVFWKTSDDKEHHTKWGSAVFEHTLSSKVREQYLAAGVTAYEGRWFAFYKPMVTLWRKLNGYKSFVSYEKDDDYVVTPMKDYPDYNLLYSKNAILLDADLNTITVY